MSRIRDELTRQLSRRLDEHRVVVWADPHSEYRGVAAELAPEGAEFHRYEGSWYELRRRIEQAFSRPDPYLVVYVDSKPPDPDPLAELRDFSGREYTRRLKTVISETMKGELTSTKLSEIAKAAATLEEAEALIEGSATGSPASLVKVFGAHEPTELVLRLATAEPSTFDDEQLCQQASHYLGALLGLTLSGPDDLAGVIARHLVLAELADAIGHLPEGLRRSYQPGSAEQRRNCAAVLRRWRDDRSRVESFVGAMRRADEELALTDELVWADALTNADTVPAYDELAFREYLVQFNGGDFDRAVTLAAARLTSLWVEREPTLEGRYRWQAAGEAARLQYLVRHRSDPPGRSVDGILRDYADRTWEIDRAHRRLESALTALTDQTQLESAARAARQTYDQWLDRYLRLFVAAAESEGLDNGDLLLQSHIHQKVLAPRATAGPVGYFMVDALRYELAHDLCQALGQQFDNGMIDLQPAVGLVPSITMVGMANLCPGADKGLSLDLDSGDRLIVKINNQSVMSPVDRLRLMQAAHGTVSDLRLDDVFRLGEQELREQTAGANVVLVRSQEIDEQGETGKLNIGLQGFESTVQHLARAVARLANHGIEQFVITADHGFLALSREVGQHMVIDKPGGRGEVHRRAFIGRGGIAGPATLRLPVSEVGLPGDLDVVVPRGVALISAGGARGFFHGGLSPQELLVPVLVVHVPTQAGATALEVEVRISPKITSQVFTGVVFLPATLLSEPVVVRPVPVRGSDDADIGTLLTAGGAEQGEGLVRLEPGQEVTLGFRTTRSLAKGDKVTLRVFDARTDRLLGSSAKVATAALAMEVDDELA